MITSRQDGDLVNWMRIAGEKGDKDMTSLVKRRVPIAILVHNARLAVAEESPIERPLKMLHLNGLAVVYHGPQSRLVHHVLDRRAAEADQLPR